MIGVHDSAIRDCPRSAAQVGQQEREQERGLSPIRRSRSGTPPEEPAVCEAFSWRYANPLFTMAYEPYREGD